MKKSKVKGLRDDGVRSLVLTMKETKATWVKRLNPKDERSNKLSLES
jgi:hypothetical protein